MALRFEKVFSVNMEMMLKMQAAYDAAVDVESRFPCP